MRLVAALLFCFSSLAFGQTSLVPAGSVWKYLANGSDQGTAWRAPAFADAAWLSGPAQLGYGDGDEATVVGFGPNASAKYITTYFRKSFAVANPAAFVGLNLQVKRDDGVIVYLNGTEVFRDTMPAGAVTAATLATTAVADDGATWLTASISPALLVAGNNVLAVEIHQSAGSSSDLSFDLALAGSSTVSVTRGPYLQIGTPSAVTVRWRTDAATDSRVRFGLSAASLATAVDDAVSTTEHVVALTGLSPNTKYFYSVGSTATTLAGADANHYFVTSPATGSQRPTRIWVLGDAGTGTASQAQVRDAYYTFTGTTHTDLWLQLGDNAYENGTDAEYQAKFFNIYGDMLRKSVTWPTLGNHDTAQSTAPPATLPYYQMFSFPMAAQAGGVASGTRNYYSFDFGNIHFVCLDSMVSSRAAGSAMLTWLQNDLAANSKDWLIAFWHHPPYTKGTHDSDTDTSATQMRQNVLPILENYGVDLVLSGHSHTYERSYLIDGHYGLSSTFTASMKKNGGSGRPTETGAYTKPLLGPSGRQGAVYAVAGSSGKVGAGPLNHPAMFLSLSVLGSMVLDVNGSQLNAKFLNNSGVVTDNFTINKGATANVPPTVALTSPAVGAAYTAPAAVTMAANAADADGTVQRVEFFQGATLVGTATAAPYSFAWTGVAAGTYSLTARAYDNLGASTVSGAVSVTVSPVSNPGTTTLIAKNSVWKYLANGSDQGTAWRAVGFSDAAWLSGTGQLGYGDGDEATVVPFGPNANAKYITTYFRRAFTVTNPATVASLALRLLRDDGAVVYLNGVEVMRSNLPAGVVAFNTLAPTAISGAEESTTYIAGTAASSLLVAGTNVIAVEMHQNLGTSSDLSFDLELIANTTTAVNALPTVTLGSPLNGETFIAPANVTLTATAADTDGTIQKVEFYRGTTLLATVSAAPYTYLWMNAPTGASAITAKAYDNVGAVVTSAVANITVNAAPPVTLLAKGSAWKYLADGTDQGTAWRGTAFNDGAWASGVGQLGYGDGDEATVVPFGPNANAKYITTYFRKTVNVTNPAQFTSLLMNLLRDDGAVVYINGVEVYRNNLPAGVIAASTLATTAISGAEETTTYVQATLPVTGLVAGANVIAVEIHQNQGASSDLSFDLELIARP